MNYRRRSLLITVSISLVFLLLVSCIGSGRKQIIPVKKFVNILVDLHLADAIASEKWYLKLTYQLDSASLYGSILNKYSVTKAQFDSTMVYYSQRPDDFQKIYNLVNTKLKRMEEETMATLENLKKVGQEVIWQDDRTLSFPPLAGDRIEIDVPVNGAGLYTVSAMLKLYPDDSSLNPRMSIYFYSDDNTPEGKRLYFEEIMYTTRNGKSMTYSASKQLINLNFTHIRGFIVNYSNTDSLFRRNMVVSAITVTKTRDKGQGTRDK
jgi:hypothetical protein